MKKPKYYIASFSGGKDSTAMVLRLIELGDPIDEVLFCDTTAEFPGMLRHVEKVKAVVEAAGIKFTTLRSEHDFEYYLADRPVPNRKKTSDHYGVPGLGWSSNKIRWCTKYLKLELIRKYLKTRQKEYEVIQYVGIAADEDYRLERKENQKPGLQHPLRGLGLYDLFHRVSCWLCPLQSYDELRKLRQHFPDLWKELHRLDARQWQTFAHGYRVADFDKRFALEDALTAAGHSIKNRAFFSDLKRHLAGEVTVEEILQERSETREHTK